MGKITVNPGVEQAIIVVIWGRHSWESVPQSSCSLEEAARVELRSHK